MQRNDRDKIKAKRIYWCPWGKKLRDVEGAPKVLTEFARVICVLFFNLAAEESECVKYADFLFVEVLI
jgi:hypothetical protein